MKLTNWATFRDIEANLNCIWLTFSEKLVHTNTIVDFDNFSLSTII